MNIRVLYILLFFSSLVQAQVPETQKRRLLCDPSFGSEPLAHTFSVVARDSATGEVGVAVQSHWFSVGTVVSWGRAGVGVVATQSFVNKSFGPRGLDLMESGLSPQAALDSLLASDEGRDVRQVALIDVQGRVAAHTGKSCIQYACDQVGESYSVQANMMLGPDVCMAMDMSMKQSAGKPLAERLILAMEAAQAVGGDFRGQQSAAVLILPGKRTGQPWEDVLVDLRVDDHPAAIDEIRRLYRVHQAYEHMNRGDYFVEIKDMPSAMREYNAARELMPEQVELQFWTALTLANVGEQKKADTLFKEVFHAEPIWRIIMPRLAAVGLVTVSAAELERILKL